MENNPYAPPKAPVSDRVPVDGPPTPASAPLYSLSQIFVATFLGSAAAGAWLAAANFKAIDQPIKARRTLWWGVAAALGTMALAFVLPEKFPSSVLPIAVAFGARAAAENQFGALLSEHKAAGGEQPSWWRVVGISLLSAAIVIALLFMVSMAYYLLVPQSGG